MKPCPAPSGLLLPAHHRPFLNELLQTLAQNEFRQSKLDPLLPRIVDNLAQLCAADDDLSAWCDELGLWVRWYRGPAYWLTNIFQFVTQARGSIYHFRACDLYSDAQANFADDHALSALETAYNGYVQNRAVLGEGFAGVGSALQEKLRYYCTYYHDWSRPFEYRQANPCADHIYSGLSQFWLTSDVQEDDSKFDINDAAALTGVIARGGTDDFAYHGVLARRFLGLLHHGHGQHALAAQQFELALADARRLRLHTEIGHLRRLFGAALRTLGKNDQARHQFEQALAYEQLEPFFSHTTYWQALSARELGDTLLRQAGRPADIAVSNPEDAAIAIDDPEKLRPALDAYHKSRILLNGHMSVQCPFPIARAAKQQLFRSFASNAIETACLLQSAKDMLAEVEFSGPREATEVVTASAAAREMSPASLADFRRNRAVYYQALNTVPARFEDYLENVTQANAGRRAYLQETIKLSGMLLPAQSSDGIVDRVLSLRIPDTVFLFFHLAAKTGFAVVVDMSSGTAAPFPVAFGEHHLRPIQEDYQRTAKDPTTRRQALDTMLSRYAKLLGPVLEPQLPFLPGKHLKIFPRLQMNAVPLHALWIKGKYLIDHCATISYGQTLGLFLESRADKPAPSGLSLRVVMGENVPWYERLMPRIRAAYAGALEEAHNTSWPALLASLSARPASDTLFACHGQYDANDLEASHLDLSANRNDGQVAFSRVFAGLDLHGCRSVIMGACESGLARAEIAAEYVGLPSAMLASGVRYVVGALWPIPQVATAILMGRYLVLIKDPSADVCAALCQAQRDVMAMTRDQVSAWVCSVMAPGPERDDVLNDVAASGDHPHAHPYFWAGLQVVGDI